MITLDAITTCAFGCSYCSIQSFYDEATVNYEVDLYKKLNSFYFDPNKRFHIGTGQSSDSLLLGNKGEVLKDLFKFANEKPNIVFELKSKSSNIKYMLENEIPKNVISTWSLNPQEIIDAEELRTATLDERIKSARKIADQGRLVGFHFHPIFYYKDYEKAYAEIIKRVTNEFDPSEVALVSMGTLTFTKNVMNEIRKKPIWTKVLQMPLVEADGKLSYPLEIKEEIFSTLYNSFSSWHDKVFFYLCMEHKSLWMPCFGHEYETNDDLEHAMISSYFNKINSLH